MRQAITDPAGNEVTLAAGLNRPGYWQATETYVRNGVSRQRNVNSAQASQWAKRDWAAYIGQRTADDRGGIGSSRKLTNPTR